MTSAPTPAHEADRRVIAEQPTPPPVNPHPDRGGRAHPASDPAQHATDPRRHAHRGQRGKFTPAPLGVGRPSMDGTAAVNAVDTANARDMSRAFTRPSLDGTLGHQRQARG